MYKQHIVDGFSKIGQIRLFSKFSIFQLSYVGYVSISPVLGGFFGHVTSAFEKLPTVLLWGRMAHFLKDLRDIVQFSLHPPPLSSHPVPAADTHPESPCGCEKNGLKSTITQKLVKNDSTYTTIRQFCNGVTEKGGKFTWRCHFTVL